MSILHLVTVFRRTQDVMAMGYQSRAGNNAKRKKESAFRTTQNRKDLHLEGGEVNWLYCINKSIQFIRMSALKQHNAIL